MPSISKKIQEDQGVGEVVFRFLEGENEGVEIRVSPPRELIVGRSEECDIFLGEKKISRQHSRITVSEDGVHASDLQSTNGTYVNKKKIGDAKLKDGDRLQIGTTVISVSISADKDPLSPGKAESYPRVEEPKIEEPHVEEPKALDPVEVDAIPQLSDEVPMEDEIDSPSGVIDVNFDIPLEVEEPAVAEPAESEPPKPKPKPKPKVEEERKPRPLSGNLSAMGLADLLQNLSQNRKSGVLQITSKKKGKITVLEGKVLAAEVGHADGVKALYRMLGWSEGEFELHSLPDSFSKSKVKSPIKESMETLLMEAFRQYDELEKLRKSLPAISKTLKIKPKFSAPLSKLHPRVLDVLQVILNEETFETVMDESPFSDLETSKIVFYLLKKDYIVAL